MGLQGTLSIINGLKKRVITFSDGLTRNVYIQDAIHEGYTTAFIIDSNTQEQLYEQGINNLGVNISDYMPYSPKTIEIKEALGQPTNRVTLRDEGDFESSFYLSVEDTRFEIKAGDWKTEELIIKYGRQILGLTDENIRELIKTYIYPQLCKTRNKVLYGNN